MTDAVLSDIARLAAEAEVWRNRRDGAIATAIFDGHSAAFIAEYTGLDPDIIEHIELEVQAANPQYFPDDNPFADGRDYDAEAVARVREREGK